MAVIGVCSHPLKAQVLTVGASGVTLKSGTQLSIDKLLLTPSADFSFSNLNITKANSVAYPSANPSISRVYHFSTPTSVFNGTIQFGYIDPAERNGIAETDLRLNVHNGATWQAIGGTVNTSQDVFSSDLFSSALQELTLASVMNPLAVNWRYFTASKQADAVWLQWETEPMPDTKDLILETSADGTKWAELTKMSGLGFNRLLQANYLHTTPVRGNNFYRLLHVNRASVKSFSSVRMVHFEDESRGFQVITNPVIKKTLQVQVNQRMHLSLHTADGKCLWQKGMDRGNHLIDVGHFPKGSYFLKGNKAAQQILIN